MEENRAKNLSNREVKSSAFTTYFSDPKNAAQLYAALNGSTVDPEEIHYTTLEGVLFVARKNDMAFTVKDRVLVISEHQSTINQNMPLRNIIYYGRTMERLVDSKGLYRERRIPIPTPEFYVFYNGDAPFPEESILKLSDAYLEKIDNPMLELTVKVININLSVNHELLRQCRPLYEYSWFIQRIKEHISSGCSRDEAIVCTIKDCQKEGIMVDFVREHGTEAVNMLFTQFNMDDALEVRYEEGFESGEISKLIKLVYRKMQKGKLPFVIAEELEEELQTVEIVCKVIEAVGVEQALDKVYEELKSTS